MLAAATSRRPSCEPSNSGPEPQHALEVRRRTDMKSWQGGVASPPEASIPIIEWGLEGAPSPVLSSKSESIRGVSGRESGPEHGRGEVGKEGVKSVFKALLELEKDDVAPFGHFFITSSSDFFRSITHDRGVRNSSSCEKKQTS